MFTACRGTHKEAYEGELPERKHVLAATLYSECPSCRSNTQTTFLGQAIKPYRKPIFPWWYNGVTPLRCGAKPLASLSGAHLLDYINCCWEHRLEYWKEGVLGWRTG